MNTKKVISDDDLKAMQNRNALAVHMAKMQMGARHLLHPANRVVKRAAPMAK